MKLGRWSALAGQPESADLNVDCDFREPQYRREVFHRFYEFHLRFRGHPGCVYYLLPYMAERLGLDEEQRLWMAYINGNTQNPVTTLAILSAFPSPRLDLAKLETWFKTHYTRLAFDTDRRYFKKSFVACVANYTGLLKGGTQREMFDRLAGPTEEATFRNMWAFCNAKYAFFGRLSVFSYLEYLRIVGVNVACDQLFLDDMGGSKSHRNGLCKVLGRDDLDWHSSNPGFNGEYTKAGIEWLAAEGAELLAEAKARAAGQPWERDVGYFTLESALCTYKSWHRPNRRYPNVYNDMLVERIRTGERAAGKRLDIFWAARAVHLPDALRLELNPADPGVKPAKQNYYRLTGKVVMLDHLWPCFKNDLNDRINALRGVK